MFFFSLKFAKQRGRIVGFRDRSPKFKLALLSVRPVSIRPENDNVILPHTHLFQSSCFKSTLYLYKLTSKVRNFRTKAFNCLKINFQNSLN